MNKFADAHDCSLPATFAGPEGAEDLIDAEVPQETIMGSLLRDVEIEALLRGVPSLVENFAVGVLGTDRSPVKGSTLDLTIGEIYVPGAKADKPGGVRKPRIQLTLKCGQTAVLKSAEKLRLPKNLSGIGFPPSTKVSLAGLLSTNPGHVDPSYVGHLHLTVVNMGDEPFPLARGDRLMRLMLFKLEGDVAHDIREPPSPLTEELLNRLSHDFLDIDNRAKSAAKKEELRLRSWQVWVTLLTAAVTGGLALGYQIHSGYKETAAQIARIEGKLSSLGGSLSVVTFEDQVKRIGVLEQKLKALETLPQPSGAAPKKK